MPNLSLLKNEKNLLQQKTMDTIDVGGQIYHFFVHMNYDYFRMSHRYKRNIFFQIVSADSILQMIAIYSCTLLGVTLVLNNGCRHCLSRDC